MHQGMPFVLITPRGNAGSCWFSGLLDFYIHCSVKVYLLLVGIPPQTHVWLTVFCGVVEVLLDFNFNIFDI